MSGYSGTPLPTKLGIRAGHRVAAVAAPHGLPDILVPWPAGGRMEGAAEIAELAGLAGSEGRFDVILLFVEETVGLSERIAQAADHLTVDGGLWVAWAKMKSPLFSGLKDSHVRDAGLQAGLVDNKVCAIDDDWSGLRFVFRRENRAAVTAEREGRPA